LSTRLKRCKRGCCGEADQVVFNEDSIRQILMDDAKRYASSEVLSSKAMCDENREIGRSFD